MATCDAEIFGEAGGLVCLVGAVEYPAENSAARAATSRATLEAASKRGSEQNCSVSTARWSLESETGGTVILEAAVWLTETSTLVIFSGCDNDCLDKLLERGRFSPFMADSKISVKFRGSLPPATVSRSGTGGRMVLQLGREHKVLVSWLKI